MCRGGGEGWMGEEGEQVRGGQRFVGVRTWRLTPLIILTTHSGSCWKLLQFERQVV